MKKFTLTAFALVCALQSVNAQSVLPQLKNAHPSFERIEALKAKAPQLALAPENQTADIFFHLLPSALYIKRVSITLPSLS